MATENGFFAQWTDPQGIVRHSFNRDGTASHSGINFSDNTIQTTAAQNLAGVTSDPVNGVVVDPTLPLTFGGVQMPIDDPSTGDVLTLTSPTQAAWVAPAPTGGGTQRQLVSAGTIGSALISLPITITWGTAFADNDYVVNANVEIGEPTSDGAVTSIICIASIQKQASGVGVIVTVANADSIPHSCTINISATHL